MAQAFQGTATGPQELPNQKPNNQTEYPSIPRPRNGQLVSSEQTISLFSVNASEQAISDAQQFIEATLKSSNDLRIGAFLIGLLEKLETVPSEIAAEDADMRSAAITIVRQLLIDYEIFALASGKGYDTSRFSTEVTEKIGDEVIDQYPIVRILTQAIQRVRHTGNQFIEAQLVTTQRIALLGIAKQMDLYNPAENT